MKETAVIMLSVTDAMKAKKTFLSLGYKCDIKRMSDSSQKGCTHHIKVNADEQTVLSVLEKYNIRYGELLRKRWDYDS